MYKLFDNIYTFLSQKGQVLLHKRFDKTAITISELSYDNKQAC